MAEPLTLREVDVSVLRLSPGDMLACYFPAKTTGVLDAVESVRAALDDAGHGDVPVLAFWDGVRVEIVRAS